MEEEIAVVADSVKEDIYETKNLRKPQHVADMGRDVTELHYVFGTDYSRRDNLAFIEDDVIVYTVATAVIFENLLVAKKEYVLSVDENGIGCVAVHPSRKLFAVGGRGLQPKIYIYSYPDMMIKKVLSGGAERGYANLSFNASGSMLASLATAPDFMLTVWDWNEEKVALKSKAFGQDVFMVRFSMDDERRLTTCGTGHIRFWKMAATFTGLKLQGHIGKFGKVELSDVAAFVELPDGKVVSGTESGALLLWEGHFIKCRFVQIGGDPCHDGEITYIQLDRKERCVITAGMDGYIRWWDFDAMDGAEVDSDVSMNYELQAVGQYYVGDKLGVRSMIDGGLVGDLRTFVIQDSFGDIKSVTFPLSTPPNYRPMEGEPDPGPILQLSNVMFALRSTPDMIVPIHRLVSCSHAGEITGMDTSPIHYRVATGGIDCTLRVWDFYLRSSVAYRKFSSAITVVRWVPLALDPSGNSILVGFVDGIVRIFSLAHNSLGNTILKRQMVFKPHNAAVTDAVFNADNILATSGKDGIVFFLNCNELNGPDNSWTPLKFVVVSSDKSKGTVYCEKLSWNPGSLDILYSCSDGLLREFTITSLLNQNVHQMAELDGDNSQLESYEATVPNREFAAVTQQQTVAPAGSQVASSASLPTNDAKEKEKEKEKPKDSSEDSTADPNAAAAPVAEDTFVLVPMKMGIASYAPSRDGLCVIAGASIGSRNQLIRSFVGGTVPSKELAMGLYSVDGKDYLKTPAVTSIAHSWSRKFVTVGTADGSVIVRPSNYLDTFVRVTGHSNTAGGVAFATTSYDDTFIVSAGRDGSIIVHKLDTSLIDERADSLFRDLDAGVFMGVVVKKTGVFDDLDEKPSLSRILCEDFQTGTEMTVSADGDVPEMAKQVIPEAIATVPDEGKPVTEPVPGEIPIDTLFPPLAIEEERLPPVEVPVSKPQPIVEADDIAPTAYSIQDAKLKSEEDARRVAAELLKDKVRQSVQALQRDFENIRELNNSFPEVVRLSPDELAVDKDYLETLKIQGRAAVQEVHCECAFEAEKAARLRSKITTRLMDGLIVEEMPLYSFGKDSKGRAPTVVRSLRTRGVEPAVKELLTSVQKMVLQGELEEAQQRANETAKQKAFSVVTEMTGRAAKKEDDHSQNDKKDHSSTGRGHGLSSAVARREMRKQRKAALSSHEKQKPNEDDDDARDVKAITFAEKNMGDYKLKCSEDYEVPEDQRVNASKKCRQMALLEESMVTMRLQFNERFLILRDLKRKIVFAIKRDNRRIREIDSELGQPELSAGNVLWEPNLDPIEFPDDRDEVTPSQLQDYIKARSSAPWEKVQPPRHTVVTGSKTIIAKNPMNNTYDTRQRPLPGTFTTQSELTVNADDDFLCKGDEAVAEPELSSESNVEYKVKDTVLTQFRNVSQPGLNQKVEKLENTVPVLMFAHSAKKKKMFLASNTNSESLKKACEYRRQRLEFERKTLLQKMEENIREFDSAIDELRVDRHSMISDLKMTELKLLVLFQEYQLLQTFESKDISLQQKQLRCLGEKTEIQANAADNKAKLDGKLEELEVWNEKSAQIALELKGILPENHPFCDILTKIFKKKIKRKKAGEDGEEDDTEEEEDDMDDDDEDEVEDSLPLNCDPVLYERVLDLREKRLDTEEISTEIQKGVDELKKTLDRLRSREKQIVKDTQQAELEMQQFQLQKQAALNQIEVVVPLRLSQLHVFETSGYLTVPSDQPTAAEAAENDVDLMANIALLKDVTRRRVVADVDMKTHVLFNRKTLKRLDVRISELHTECSEARVHFQELHKERVRLNKDREGKREEIDNWRKRCEELQMLKFGRCIDLDDLEADADRSKEEEAEMGVREIEEMYRVKTSALARDIEALQEELARTTTKNTELLRVVAELTESKLTITRELNATDSSAPQPSRVDEYREKEERTRVASYVQLQAREIESLRIELFMLKRKDAATLAMPALPVPGASTSQLLGNTNSNTASTSFLPPIPGSSKGK